LNICVEKEASAAFPAEIAEETAEENSHPESGVNQNTDFFDEIVQDEDIGNDTEELLVQEREILEEMPLPGIPKDEADRKKMWLKLPRAARAAIRRLHNMFGHKPKEPLIELMKAARCPEDYIKAARFFRCPDCDRTKHLPYQTSKASLPPPYEFNHSIGIDINYLADADGETHMFFNIVDLGTGFQLEILLRQGHGTPSST
jgi:hypothetical protein